MTVDEQKKFLISKIKNVGWEASRFAEAIRHSKDLYLERLSQVKASHWSNDRIAMIGDAAYSVTPIGGKGTDLAIAGAYIIATELARSNNHIEAFANYEKRLKPFVKKVQKLPLGVPKLIYPRTKLGVVFLNLAFKIAGSKASKAVLKLISKRKKKPEQKLNLPEPARSE